MAEKKYVSDNPKLMEEWNWERNTDLSPYETASGSHKKAWWKCRSRHEWQAIIDNRDKGRGCPYCAGHRIIIGHNDLKTINPSSPQKCLSDLLS